MARIPPAVMGRGSADADGEVRRLREHVEALRSEIGHDVAELEERLHDALDVRRHARRHPALATVVVAGAAFTVAAVATTLWRHRAGGREDRIEKRRPSGRGPRETTVSRVLVATASALSVLCARQLGKALFHHLAGPSSEWARGRSSGEERHLMAP